MKAILVLCLAIYAVCIYAQSYEDAGDVTDYAVKRCPRKEGVNATIFEHPTTCKYFIMCSWGRPIVMKCPKDTLFNPEKSVCDHPWNVDCDKGQVIEETP